MSVVAAKPSSVDRYSVVVVAVVGAVLRPLVVDWSVVVTVVVILSVVTEVVAIVEGVVVTSSVVMKVSATVDIPSVWGGSGCDVTPYGETKVRMFECESQHGATMVETCMLRYGYKAESERCINYPSLVKPGLGNSK